jgi:hypothetical protein
MGPPYTRFIGDAAASINYIDLPSGVEAVPYPEPPSEALTVLGPVFTASVYAKHLDTIEVGSSGSVTFSLKDRRAAELAKAAGAESATQLRSLDTWPLHIVPGDAERTVRVGDLSVRTGEAGACAVLSHPGGAYSLDGLARVGRTAAGNVEASFGGAVDLRANAITWVGASGASLLGLAANVSANALTLTGNLGSVAVTSTDPQNRVRVSNMLTYNNLMGGRNYQVVRNGNVATPNFAGFYVVDNLFVDNSASVYTNSIAPTSGGKVNVVGDLQVTGNLMYEGSHTIIEYEELKVKDNMITVANGSTTLAASDASGIEVQTGPDEARAKLAWRLGANGRADLRAQNPDDESFWRVEGGHLRLSAGDNLDYGLRVNARGELEVFKVHYDVAGAPSRTVVVSRQGGNMIDLIG